MFLSMPYSSSTCFAALVVLALFVGLVWKIKLAVRFSPLWAINGQSITILPGVEDLSD